MKCIICMSMQLNILCLICINRQYPQNCIEFDLTMTHDLCSIFIWNIVKQGRSLTDMASPDEIQHVRSKSESDCWRKENISRKALWFLSLFQNLVRRTLYLCSQKINSVLLWERTRTRFTAGNSPYLEQRLRVQAGRSAMHAIHHTVAYLHSNVPEFIQPENWPPNSPDLNLADYSVQWAL